MMSIETDFACRELIESSLSRLLPRRRPSAFPTAAAGLFFCIERYRVRKGPGFQIHATQLILHPTAFILRGAAAFHALRQGRHPGAAAVIGPIVHDRAAFGLRFFPCCQG